MSRRWAVIENVEGGLAMIGQEQDTIYFVVTDTTSGFIPEDSYQFEVSRTELLAALEHVRGIENRAKK